MNLLVVSVDFLPRIGGISLMTHYVSNAFAELGHSVRVLAPRGACVPEDYEAGYELIPDVDSSTALRETPAYWTEILRIMALLEHLDRKQSVEHILLMHVFYYGAPIMEYCLRHNKRYSVFIHGFELRSQLLKPPKWRERLGFDRRAYEDLRHGTIQVTRFADVRFVNSTATGELLETAGCVPFDVVGCGVPRDVVHQKLLQPHCGHRGICRARFFGRHDARMLGFLGRVVPSKNVDFLIEMLQHLDDTTHLAIAGAGDTEALLQVADQLGLTNRVHFIGRISEDEKWDFLAAIDLLCLPSKMMARGQMEGFGIVLIEATIRGTPVAVSQEGGQRDFVLDHNGLYLDITDARFSATAVAEFLKDPARVNQAVANAQKLVVEQLTYDRICSRMLAALPA